MIVNDIQLKEFFAKLNKLKQVVEFTLVNKIIKTKTIKHKS